MNETAAAYGMGSWPLWAVVVGLFVVVMARSHLFYWLGRGLTGGATRIARAAHHDDARDDRVPAGPAASGSTSAEHATAVLPALPGADETGARARTVRLLHSPAARRGLALVHRFGPFAVVLAYLTVGVQTAVFVGSGVLRMSYPRFCAASVPGSVAWAFIWGTIGYTAFWAAVRLAGASPWALVGVLLVVAGAVTAVVLRRRAGRATTGRPSAATPAADELV